MKRIISTITAVFLIGGFMLSPAKTVLAFDQGTSCDAYPSGEPMMFLNGIKQYFKPAQNHITKIAITTTNDNEGKWRFSLKKFKNTTVYSTIIDNAATGGGVKTHYLYGFDETVSSGYYFLHVENISGAVSGIWYHSRNANCVPDGYAFWDNTAQPYDMDFLTFGYNATTPPAPPSSPPATEETQTTGTTSTSVTSTSDLAMATPLSEDPSIKEPVLTYIEKNGKKTDAPIANIVSFSKKDKIMAVGTSFAGAKVAVFIGDQGYFADTDTSGNWSINLPVDKLKEGEQSIQGQSQKDGKGSVKKELFKVNVLGAKTGSGNSAVKPFLAGWNILWTLGGAGLLLLVLLGLLFVARKRKTALNKSIKLVSKKTKNN